MRAWLRQKWCDWTHGGGSIKRDSAGRINWQCRKCGRWSDSPVPLEQERKQTDAALKERLGETK